jgi:hypothetical protein
MRFVRLLLITCFVVPPVWADTEAQIKAQEVAIDYILGKLTPKDVIKKMGKGYAEDVPVLIETVTRSNASIERQQKLINDLAQEMILDIAARSKGNRLVRGIFYLSIAGIVSLGFAIPPDPQSLREMSEMGARLYQAFGALILGGSIGVPLLIFLKWIEFRKIKKRVITMSTLDDCAKSLGAKITPAVED